MNIISGAYIETILKNSVKNIIIDNQNNVIINTGEKNLLNLLVFFKLHTNLQTKLLLDIFAVDYPYKKKRFEISYVLISVMYNKRFFLKLNVIQDQIVISATKVYNSANWLEREIWDMFGIFFKEHKDLRRILTDYGFEGFPLRKDFPLTGYLQFRYDDETQTVVSEPVELTQEFRSYEYTMPWELTY